MLRYLILFLLVNDTYSSHYRGGTVSWSIRESGYINGSSTIPVRIQQRHSWRRSAASMWVQPLCTHDTITDGTALLGEGYFSCVSPTCSTFVSNSSQTISAGVLCTDFDEQYDYATGESYTTIQLPINQRLLYTFDSCCWIELLPYSSTPGWTLNLIIDTNRRLDGKFNNAPVTTMQPLYTVEIGRAHLINIPMADIDGDRLSCRWGDSSLESGGIYLPKGDLLANPCVLTYNALRVGYEGVAVVIEDFDANNQVLSSIPLQFIIQIVPLQTTTTTTTLAGQATGTYEPGPELAPTCPYIPEYVGDWSAGACIGVPSNNLTEIRIVVQVPCINSSTSIVDILTVSPTNMTRSNITQDSQYSNRYIMMLQWTPQSSQYGIHQFCVTPRDSNGRTGQTACFNILVDARSPQFVSNSMSPTGIVPQNQSVWTISTDVDIVHPTDGNISAVFYKRDRRGFGTDTLVHRVSLLSAYYQPRQITFSTDGILWEQGEQYYILLDGGTATVNQSCGLQSFPIINTYFWTFSILADPATSSTGLPSTTSVETTTVTTTTTTSVPLNQACPEVLPFGAIKNVTSSESQQNYSFCFNVETTFADVTISANTWTPCSTWKTSGAADPSIDLYRRLSNAVLLAQNDDGLSVPERNCYAAVISYRLPYGRYLVVNRHPKCNYGRFEVRLSAEITNE